MGTTGLRWSRIFARRAHPHTRGDDVPCGRIVICSGGSPPHAWGRPPAVKPQSMTAGLTPTRVGTTGDRGGGRDGRRAHPHTRGDDEADVPALCSHAGSPPHAWGRRRPGRVGGVHRRLTPTRVGTTYLLGDAPDDLGAHPHTRGDDVAMTCSPSFAPGSPPHAWGRPGYEAMRGARIGLTPTRVGTTRATMVATRLAWAHPHTRGDDQRDNSRTRCRAWLTPTRVGTTGLTPVGMAAPKAHPHTRGDDATVRVVARRVVASPPHAWGRRGHILRQANTIGLTPTRVGTTAVRGIT